MLGGCPKKGRRSEDGPGPQKSRSDFGGGSSETSRPRAHKLPLTEAAGEGASGEGLKSPDVPGHPAGPPLNYRHTSALIKRFLVEKGSRLVHIIVSQRGPMATAEVASAGVYAGLRFSQRTPSESATQMYTAHSRSNCLHARAYRFLERWPSRCSRGSALGEDITSVAVDGRLPPAAEAGVWKRSTWKGCPARGRGRRKEGAAPRVGNGSRGETPAGEGGCKRISRVSVRDGGVVSSLARSFRLVGREGLEPPTPGLKARRSAR